MIAQIVADPGPDDRNFDPEGAKFGRRTDAGSQQDRRRLDRACRHDHPPRTDEAAVAVTKDANALGTAAIHDETLGMRACPDREIAAPAHGLAQIAYGARNPPIIPVREGRRENSILELSILVLSKRHAAGRQGLADSRAERRPVCLRNAADRNRSILAVQGSVEIEVCFQLAKIRQHVVPAPAGRAEIAPLVIVTGQTTIGRLNIDARAPAHHPRLLIGARDRWLVSDPSGGCGKPRPDIAVAVKYRHRVAVENLLRLRSRRGVASGLDQQHAAGTIRRQAIGNDTAGRTAADDDVIERGFVHGTCTARDGGPLAGPAGLVNENLPLFPERAMRLKGRWQR